MKVRRNLRSEKKWFMVFDFIVLLLASTILCLLLAYRINVGLKSFIASAVIYVCLMFTLMHALDEYKIYVSGMYERCVIFILSSVYSYISLAFVDLIVLNAARMALIHAAFLITLPLMLAVENMIVDKIFQNPVFFEKPRLLIIETDAENFKRMRRMKYGSLNNYDSWYEGLDANDSNALDYIINERMKDFEAVCLLDKVKDSVHERIVKAAFERGMDLYIVPKLNDIGRSHSELSQFDDVVTMYIPGYKLSVANEILKRITDIVIALIGLVIAIIPMAVIAAAIKLTSKGDVFYKQVRLTKDKREFEIYKFRTMVQDAEKLSGPVFARKDDARITPVGKILRAMRLDELPQLINILKGDMSIVGPRPERPYFVEQFEKTIDSYNFRFAVKAGLTGLSHVYGRYSTYMYDRTCFDLMYITHYSYLLDLKIILLTSKIMFLKSAAEGEDEFKVSDVKTSDEAEDKILK